LEEVAELESLSDVKAGEAMALMGRVNLNIKGVFRLRAQRAVVWLDPKVGASAFELLAEARSEGRTVPIWAVRALYAEGGRIPALFQAAGRVFRCSSLYYDFTEHRGLLIDAELRMHRESPTEGKLPDIVLRAKRFRATDPARWVAKDATLFSSSYHDASVRLEVSRVVLSDPATSAALGDLMRLSAEGREKGEGVPEEEVAAVLKGLKDSARNVERKHVEMEGITARFFKAPVMRWGSLDVDGREPSDLRVELDVNGRGLLGSGVRVGVGRLKKPVGFVVGGAYYFNRGPAADLTLEVDSLGGKLRGQSFGVYLHDKSDDLALIVPTRDRFYTKNQYRWNFDRNWRLDGEYSDLSDEDFLRIYDQQQLKEGKELETLLHLRNKGTYGYLNLVGKIRTIDFEPTLERRPSFTASLPVLKLLRLGESSRGDPITLQLAGNLDVSNLNLRPGALEFLSGVTTTRAHADPTLYVSFDLGPFRVVPFGVFQFTAYDDTPSGASLSRFAGSAGVRTDVQLSRWYTGFRHVVNLTFSYVDQYAVTEDASSFFPLEPVDQITPFEAFTFRWRNRFQHRTPTGLQEYLDIELLGRWFPERRAPFGETRDGFMELDVEWWKGDRYSLSARLQYDFDSHSFETGSLEGWWKVHSRLYAGLGYRHLQGDSDMLTMTAESEVDTRWRIVGISQFNLRDGRISDQGLRILRMGLTTVLGVRLSYDPGGNDFNFSVEVDLLETFRRKRWQRTGDFRRGTVWR
ncbi:MAG: LPS assembly protein LptD, partial [Planctomycetota bacterium]